MDNGIKFGMIAGAVAAAVFLVFYLITDSPEQSDSARAVGSSDAGQSPSVVNLRSKEQEYLPEGQKEIVDKLSQVRQRPIEAAPATSPQSSTAVSGAAPKKPVVKYTVVSGDTLSDISKRFYGTTAKWQLILDANRKTLKNPAGLKPGMELIIPPDPAQ